MLTQEETGSFSDLLFYLERKGIDKDSAREVVLTAFNWGVSAAVDRMRPSRPQLPDDAPEIAPTQLTMLDGGVREPKVKKAAAAKQVARTFPEGFCLDDGRAAFATSRGFSTYEIQRMWERFRDRNLARGEKYANWDAAWRTWVNNQVEFKNRDQSNRQPAMLDGRL